MLWILSLFPKITSSYGKEVDNLFWFIFFIALFFFLLVQILMIYFVIKYRNRREEEVSKVEGNTFLEIVWTIIPTIILIVIFFYGVYVFDNFQRRPPANSMEIKVIGHQWWWEFQYPNGYTTRDTLIIPVNKPIKLIMTSQDVIHSFFVRHFRIKEDLVPGRYTWTWFKAVEPGMYDIQCAEYCGSRHSKMIGYIKAIDTKEFESWLASVSKEADLSSLSPVERGKRISQLKGCNSCHSVDGSPGVGPTWKGLYNHEMVVIEGGKEKKVIADENYLRESIVNPNAKIVKGYQGIMPSYQGQLSEDDILAIIEYIKSLK
jgi:cytochrome c oxidase subunit 2